MLNLEKDANPEQFSKEGSRGCLCLTVAEVQLSTLVYFFFDHEETSFWLEREQL